MAGDFASDWLSLHSATNKHFLNCHYPLSINMPSYGTHVKMYVRVNNNYNNSASTEVGMKDGYYVFTNDHLKSIGLGFIIRWRVTGSTGNSFGAWKSPAAGWPNDNSTAVANGLEFWYLDGIFGHSGYSHNPSGTTEELYLLHPHTDTLDSYNQWVSLKNQAEAYYKNTWVPDATSWSETYGAHGTPRFVCDFQLLMKINRVYKQSIRPGICRGNMIDNVH